MFSLQMATDYRAPERRRGPLHQLPGVALGFAAGLIIVIAMDALVLNHMLFHEVSRSHWQMPRVVHSAIALTQR